MAGPAFHTVGPGSIHGPGEHDHAPPATDAGGSSNAERQMRCLDGTSLGLIVRVILQARLLATAAFIFSRPVFATTAGPCLQYSGLKSSSERTRSGLTARRPRRSVASGATP